MTNRISLLDVKHALRDGRFRTSLPQDLQPEVEKYLRNPTCACNTKFYRTVFRTCVSQLEAYFPGRCVEEVPNAELPPNQYTVINCHKDELEGRLRKLSPGPKQIAVARYEDQITAIVTEMDTLE